MCRPCEPAGCWDSPPSGSSVRAVGESSARSGRVLMSAGPADRDPGGPKKLPPNRARLLIIVAVVVVVVVVVGYLLLVGGLANR